METVGKENPTFGENEREKETDRLRGETGRQTQRGKQTETDKLPSFWGSSPRKVGPRWYINRIMT